MVVAPPFTITEAEIEVLVETTRETLFDAWGFLGHRSGE